VIAREALQAAATPQVGSAVSDPDDATSALGDLGADHRRTHGPLALELRRGLAHDLVGFEYRSRQIRGRDQAEQGLLHQPAGLAPVGMPSHAIGDEPKSMLLVPTDGIFVRTAASTRISQCREFLHELRTGPERCARRQKIASDRILKPT
jgi:hypothetical protein